MNVERAETKIIPQREMQNEKENLNVKFEIIFTHILYMEFIVQN